MAASTTRPRARSPSAARTGPTRCPGLVTGLPSGSNLVLEDSTSGDTVTVTANGPFTLPAQIGVGTGYDVRVKTQPAGLPAGAQCTVANGQSNSIQGPVSNVIVSCPVQQISARLNNPNGLAFSGGKLYVANPGSSQILVFEESSTTTSASLGLADIIAGRFEPQLPSRLAFDPSGRYLFATYGAQGAAGEVLVYDTQSGNAKMADHLQQRHRRAAGRRGRRLRQRLRGREHHQRHLGLHTHQLDRSEPGVLPRLQPH